VADETEVIPLSTLAGFPPEMGSDPPNADWKSAKSPPLSLGVPILNADDDGVTLAGALVKSPKSAPFSSDLGSKSSETSTPGDGGAGLEVKLLIRERE